MLTAQSISHVMSEQTLNVGRIVCRDGRPIKYIMDLTLYYAPPSFYSQRVSLITIKLNFTGFVSLYKL